MTENNRYIDEKRRKRTGLIVTICVHLSFIACFILFGFKVVDPKKGTTELTWEVQGVTDAGGESKEKAKQVMIKNLSLMIKVRLL